MIGLFLSGCFTAADVLSGEIILPGAGAYRYKICAAKAASNNVGVGPVRKGVFREVFSLEKKKEEAAFDVKLTRACVVGCNLGFPHRPALIDGP